MPPNQPTPRPHRQQPATHGRNGGGVDRLRVIALLVLTTIVAVIWAVSTSPSGPEQPPAMEQPTEITSTIASASTTMPHSAASSTTVAFVALEQDLAEGNAGDSVWALQARLTALSFDPGPTDGVFGPATTRAVWAFEKLVLATPAGGATGTVTPAMWEVMNQPLAIQARRPSASDTHVEVYLLEQVAVVFVAGAVRLITHISSGSGDDWCDEVTIDNDDGTQTTKGICGTSITPGGVFHVEREVEGWKNAALGRLYNPVFFNYGIAIHGAGNVPDHPASHGCVRIPLHIAEYFPSLVTRGDLIYVFDGVNEPEFYGAQLPMFDHPDPNYTTTTSTSTTVLSTTAAPPTTRPPAPTTSTTAAVIVTTPVPTTTPPVTTSTLGT